MFKSKNRPIPVNCASKNRFMWPFESVYVPHSISFTCVIVPQSVNFGEV